MIQKTKRSLDVLKTGAMKLRLWSDVYEIEAMRLRQWSVAYEIEAMRLYVYGAMSMK